MAKSAAVKRDVRWRQSGTSEWGDIVRISATKEIVLDGLDRDKTYDVQVRNVSSCGAMSGWVTTAGIVPENSQRVGNDHINMLRTGGIGSAWTGFSISYVSSPTSATISCTSGTLQDGALNPAYDASSVVVTGTADTTVQYWLYYDDPAGEGGSFALGATTNYSDLSANQGRINVGDVSVVFPASGTGGGGGSPGGGGCPVIEAWVIRRTKRGWEFVRAGDVRVGDFLRLTDGTWGLVSFSERKWRPCVKVIGKLGYSLSCSETAPLGLREGGSVLAPASAGARIAARHFWGDSDTIEYVRSLGGRWVQHLSVANGFYLAGDSQVFLFSHHNLKPAGP